MRTNLNTQKILVPVGFLVSFFLLNSGAALFLGVLIALIFGNPYLDKTRRLTKPMLAWSIVGLGAGMNFLLVLRAGVEGVTYTFISLVLVLLTGLWISRLFKISREMGLLINVGTAICGGSAIAAVSSAVNAKDESISVSMGIVFILNALALFIFPPLGHWLNLSSEQFGLWSALAIHDTSSVVGATMQYSQRALEIGSTVKLARALWIIPVTIFFARFFNRDRDDSNDKSSDASSSVKKKPAFPWFIGGFVIVSALVTNFSVLQPVGHQIEWLAKRFLVATLFLIGSGLTLATLKKVGLRTFLHGFALWLIVLVVSLQFVRS